tara:strand:- start:1939 stop:2202 length:264 start_codon:yes stop_codon:yes gene_type:complete
VQNRVRRQTGWLKKQSLRRGSGAEAGIGRRRTRFGSPGGLVHPKGNESCHLLILQLKAQFVTIDAAVAVRNGKRPFVSLERVKDEFI